MVLWVLGSFSLLFFILRGFCFLHPLTFLLPAVKMFIVLLLFIAPDFSFSSFEPLES